MMWMGSSYCAKPTNFSSIFTPCFLSSSMNPKACVAQPEEDVRMRAGVLLVESMGAR